MDAQADLRRTASLLDDGNARVRGDAFAALVSHEGDVAGVLAGCLESPSSNTRACAILILANRGGPGAAEQIARLAEDPSPAVRECVAGAIGHLGATEKRDVLARLLSDPEAVVREGAARASARLGIRADISGDAGAGRLGNNP